MVRRSGFGLTKPAKIGLFAGIIVLVIIGISIMMIPTSAPTQESTPAPPTPSGTASGTASNNNVVASTYGPVQTGKIGQTIKNNCPTAKNPSSPNGEWCSFDKEQDVLVFCNDPANNCTGYSHLIGAPAAQKGTWAAQAKGQVASANSGWEFYPKLT